MLTPDQQRHKTAIAVALRELEQALSALVQSLAHDNGPVSAEGAVSDGEARRRIGDAFTAIDYGQDDMVNETPICLGVAGVSPTVLDRAATVNAAKQRFRAVCSPLQNQRVRVPVKDGQGGRVVKPLPLVRVILRELQRSDLNLLAAYRKVPVLTGRVARVTYTRAHTRAVYRKTRAEIVALLEASNRSTTATDLARLRQLPASESHLALVKDRHSHVRANVWFDGLDRRGRGRVQAIADLPLLYPLGRSRELPEISYPEPDVATAAPSVQREGKLEAARFLESLPVYRYRPTPDRRHRRSP
jgi:hypothetical protein